MVEQAEEHVPNPSLTTGSPSDPEDYDPRATKVPRCELCYDYDHLLEQHLALAAELEETKKIWLTCKMSWT